MKAVRDLFGPPEIVADLDYIEADHYKHSYSDTPGDHVHHILDAPRKLLDDKIYVNMASQPGGDGRDKPDDDAAAHGYDFIRAGYRVSEGPQYNVYCRKEHDEGKGGTRYDLHIPVNLENCCKNTFH